MICLSTGKPDLKLSLNHTIYGQIFCGLLGGSDSEIAVQALLSAPKNSSVVFVLQIFCSVSLEKCRNARNRRRKPFLSSDNKSDCFSNRFYAWLLKLKYAFEVKGKNILWFEAIFRKSINKHKLSINFA